MLNNINVLLVEDDCDLAAAVHDYLLLDQIQVDHAFNGQAGLQLASQQHYHVILLDLMLPRMNGISVCQHLRKQGVDTPILMLTARDNLDDKREGFQAGTDDYLVKPFAMVELSMRIQALAKRRSSQARVLQVADLKLDLDIAQASRQGQVLKLSPSSWTLLKNLAQASPQKLSRQQLEEALWPDSPPDSNSLKVHLFHLRKQLDKPFTKPLLHTLPNQGFVLKDMDQEEQ